jgi:hypothetical protein
MYILNHGVNTGVLEWTTLTTLVHVHLKSLGKQKYSRMNNTNTTDICTFKITVYTQVLQNEQH